MKKKRVILVLSAVIAVVSFSACDNPWWPQKDQGTLSYNANGGTGKIPEPQTAFLRSTITVASQNDLRRNGYNFNGWNTRADGTGTNYAVGAVYKMNGDATLFARWGLSGNTDFSDPYNPGSYDPGTGNPVNPQVNSGPPYKVTYLAGSSASGVPPEDTNPYDAGAKVTLSDGKTLINDGYNLAAWMSVDDKRPYVIDTNFSIERNMTFEPVWLKNANGINVYKDGDESEMQITGLLFSETDFGYKESDEAVEPQAFRIKNLSNTDTGPIRFTNVERNPENVTAFGLFATEPTLLSIRMRAIGGQTISVGQILTDNIEPNKNIEFWVAPVPDLPKGNYSVTCSVSNDRGDVYTSFIVEFRVNSIPLKVEMTGMTYTNPDKVLTPIISDNGAIPSYTEREASFAVTVSGFVDKAHATGVELIVGANVAGLVVAIDGLGSGGGGASDGTTTFDYTKNGKDFYKKTFNDVKVILSDTHEFSEDEVTVSVGLVKTTDLVDHNYDITLARAEHPEKIKIIDGWNDTRPIPVYGDLTYSGDSVRIKAFNYYANTSNGLARHYVQTENITLPPVAAGKSNWTAIGNWPAFTGSYDGGGRTITGLVIDDSWDYYQGMFGYIENATVKNLGLVDVSITTVGEYVGGLVGYNDNGTLTGIYVTTTSNGTSSITGEDYTGGVVGYNNNSTLDGFYFTSTGSGTASATGNGNVGGVVGSNEGGTVQNSYSTGNVSVTGNGNVGGVVGYNDGGTVKYSYSTGDVIGNTQVGGVVGKNSGDGTTVVESCYYTTGNVEGTGDVGGVVGLNEYGKVRYCYVKSAAIKAPGGGSAGGVVGSNGNSSSIVEYCYGEDNDVYSAGQAAGGVVGYNRDMVQYCYASGGTVEGESRAGGVVGKISNGGASTVQYCYSTSPVSTTNIFIGGIVGEIMTVAAGTAKIRNNVALNSSVTMDSSVTTYTIRRVIGGRTNSGTYNSADNPITNSPFNYAWSDMPIANNYGSGTINPGSSPNTDNYHGKNITSNDGSGNGYLVASWWTNAANWTGGAWSGSNGNTTIWYIVDGSLPKLNGMPSGTSAQNPVVVTP